MNLDTGTGNYSECHLSFLRVSLPISAVPPPNPSLSHDYAAHSCTARRVQLPRSVSCRGIKLQARPADHQADGISCNVGTCAQCIDSDGGRPPERTATAYIGDCDVTISESVVQQATEHSLRKRHWLCTVCNGRQSHLAHYESI